MALQSTDLIIVQRGGVLYKATAKDLQRAIGPVITVGTTAPTSPQVNDVWIDTN